MQADVTEDNAGNGSGGAESPNDPDDAGWDWVVTSPPAPFFHTTAASPVNLYGETVLGLYQAYIATGSSDPEYFTAMQDAANWIRAAGRTNYRTASDIVFLMYFGTLVGDASYADSAKAKFDWRITNQGGGTATGFAQYLRDVRGITQGYPNGIIAWDLGEYVEASQMLAARYPLDPSNYDAKADEIAEVLWQDSFNGNPGLFDVDDDAGWDPTWTNVNYWWYTTGISGLIDAFRISGSHTAEIAGLASRLLDSIHPNGALSDQYGAHAGDEDWQDTAIGAVTLALTGGYGAQVDEMCEWLAGTQHASGGWLYTSGNHYPQVGGEIVRALAYSTTTSSSIVTPVSPGCITGTECVTVPVDIMRGDATELRAFSVTFTVSAELALCTATPDADILQGTYLSSLAGSSTHFEVLDNGGGSYTADCTLLGEPCGQTVVAGTLFTISVKKAGGDGTGTITVTSVALRDCDNATIAGIPGDAATITIDTAPPAAIALTAAQDKTGNGTDGLTFIDVTVPAVATTDLVRVYRKGFGAYPEYDDNGGAAPGIPATEAAATAAGWTQAFTVPGPAGTTVAHQPPARDFWYFVAFVEDACGNVSGAASITGGTLDYHLGDVHNGSDNCAGENLVNTSDISFLGANYGITLGAPPQALACLDVGPTTNYSVNARPTTDNQVQFEDLMMFAINYGQVSKAVVVAAPAATDELQVLVPEDLGPGAEIVARLWARGTGRIQGLSIRLAWNDQVLQPAGIEPGELLRQLDGVAFTPEAGVVDAALLGLRDRAIAGEGELVRVRFRVIGSGDPAIRIESVEARDGENQPVELDARAGGSGPQAGVPRATALLPNIPNPFNPTTRLAFTLAARGPVELSIYTVGGRLVRPLVRDVREPGFYEVTWNGAGENGRQLSSGVYYARLVTGDAVRSRALMLVK
jgi:hypothetical protein